MKKTTLYVFLFLICLTGCSLFSSSSDEDKNNELVQDSGETETEGFSGGTDEFGSDSEAGSSGQPEGMSTEENFSGGNQVDEYADDEYGSDGESVNSDETDLPGSPMTDHREKDLFASQETASYNDNDNDNDNDFSSSDQMSSMGQSRRLIPVKKMKSSVYQMSGVNINRLYVVRSGDNVQSIATKIYGNDRSEDLYSYNPHFRGKTLNVGDKIYYQSPHNPTDSMMKTYYEDNHLQPQYYVTQEGDNLRKISKKFLGHRRSWMEIYATNESIESKGRLPAGLQIHYWPDSGMSVAENSNPQDLNEPPAPEPEPEPEPSENQDPNMAMGQNQEIQPGEDPNRPGEDPNIEVNDTDPAMAQTGDMDNFNDSQNNELPPPPEVSAEVNNQSPNESASLPPEGKTHGFKEGFKKIYRRSKTDGSSLWSRSFGCYYFVHSYSQESVPQSQFWSYSKLKTLITVY